MNVVTDENEEELIIKWCKQQLRKNRQAKFKEDGSLDEDDLKGQIEHFINELLDNKIIDNIEKEDDHVPKLPPNMYLLKEKRTNF